MIILQEIPAWNTRCMKHSDGHYEIRLASSETSQQDDTMPCLQDVTSSATAAEEKFSVTRGDYSSLMKLICDNLTKAKVLL